MTYEELVEKARETAEKLDGSKAIGHLAVEFGITDEDAAGAFYLEVADGKVTVEPYDYNDFDVRVETDAKTALAIIGGRTDGVKAAASGKILIERNAEALGFFMAAKPAAKTAAKKPAAKKTTAKKTAAKKPAAKKTAAKKPAAKKATETVKKTETKSAASTATAAKKPAAKKAAPAKKATETKAAAKTAPATQAKTAAAAKTAPAAETKTTAAAKPETAAPTVSKSTQTAMQMSIFKSSDSKKTK